jgi:hypothetical protein
MPAIFFWLYFEEKLAKNSLYVHKNGRQEEFQIELSDDADLYVPFARTSLTERQLTSIHTAL